MAKDYSNLGLDRFFKSKSSIPSMRQPAVPGIRFDSNYDVQTRDINVSNFVNNNFIVTSNVSTADGSVVAGSSVYVSTTLTPNNPPTSYKNMGIPFVNIYEGTSAVGSNAFFPYEGDGVTDGQFQCHAGFLYNSSNATASQYIVNVYNSGTATATIHAVTQWKYTNHGNPQS